MIEENYNFQKLTPVNDAELSIYKNALDFVFENPDLKNIGVSGAYSAGKSSVVETYKRLRPDIKFMHISLAYFQSASESDRRPTEQSENVLEGKILNQLIHQIEPIKIPQTNFRVKRQLWLSSKSQPRPCHRGNKQENADACTTSIATTKFHDIWAAMILTKI